MRVKVYKEGCASGGLQYDETPAEAVRQFCEYNTEDLERRHHINLIVVPVDAEARALPGWHVKEGEEDPVYRMFIAKARVVVDWAVREVPTLNPYHKNYVTP